MTQSEKALIRDYYLDKGNSIAEIITLTKCIPQLIEEFIQELTNTNKKPLPSATLFKEAKGSEHELYLLNLKKAQLKLDENNSPIPIDPNDRVKLALLSGKCPCAK